MLDLSNLDPEMFYMTITRESGRYCAVLIKINKSLQHEPILKLAGNSRKETIKIAKDWAAGLNITYWP